MVNGKLSTQHLIVCGLGVAIPLLYAEVATAAADLTNTSVTNWKKIQYESFLPRLETPELSPLEEVNHYLRQEEDFFNNTPRLVIKLSERRLYVYRGDKLEASYPVAIGQPGWETPTGNFQVTQMVQNPVWKHPLTGEVVAPGPENPLGPRWMAFWSDGTNYIGFHGTNDEELVGQAVSHGCIRMRNDDVKALYNRVALGTSVTVQE
ncbi:MAG: L,D-transpeptidase [Moorea sp. SIO1G6]|nr:MULTISPECIES: L,D-transpeptidase [unclassified Moorena]NEP64270.1 L,D-transpeptidase [Moorena sp. SIO3A5]NER88365.1 L,D-transpeptidase [Moorena sp. SIO3A2]NES44514.1 L,D-transpeptidase [Moorena sp. SIO2C4]NET66093.1 L,D-transpeptidase [Moorena sp. SIO1G6]